MSVGIGGRKAVMDTTRSRWLSLRAATVGIVTLAPNFGCGGGEIDSGGGRQPGSALDAKTGMVPAGPAGRPTSGTGVAGAGNVLVNRDGSGGAACVNLQCQQRQCPTGTSTTISGKVYDPAGKNPLYNVAVYIPNATPEPLKAGASCDACDSLYTGQPIAAAVTDAAGSFTLSNAPEGANIPVVIQVGKWRRQITIASVSGCQDNLQPDRSLRLPRNQSEGDIPNIAISTGGADTLECLLRRVGVDPSEYVPGAGGQGRVHIFQGSGDRNGNSAGCMGGGQCSSAPNTDPAAPASPTALWPSAAELMRYDIVLLSCEGDETEQANQQALHDYASAGGRVFASHFHYAWFNTGPYASENLATWSAGSNDIGDIEGEIVTTLPNGQVFPKGQALQQWLSNVGALTNGKLPIEEARHNADVTGAHTPSQAWIIADQNSEAPMATQYFSFNTPTMPVGAPDSVQQCGRVVFSDLHVGAASEDDAEEPVPLGCRDVDLSPQEKALEFMLFDLSSCIVPDDTPPTIPTPL